MGMQCHFRVSDLPENTLVYKSFDVEDGLTEHYIIATTASYYFNTDPAHKEAWFDIGFMSTNQLSKLHWLIRNRVPFNCS